jgi:PhoPQ-activated pathogenicity-related protein
MDNKPKVRLGNGKKRSATWLTAAICISDAEAHAYTYNGKKYVNVNVNIYDQPNDYGKDVAITLNDYKKDEAVPKANEFEAVPSDNLPF